MRLVLIAVLLLAACSGGSAPPPAGDVNVELRDFEVRMAKTTLPAGQAKIVVRNAGSSVHELTIIKTDLEPEKLVVDGAKAKEDGLVTKSADLNPGATATLTANLAAGKYVFICNQPGHYALGMRTRVTVP